jgi:hypothetical protein
MQKQIQRSASDTAGWAVAKVRYSVYKVILGIFK